MNDYEPGWFEVLLALVVVWCVLLVALGFVARAMVYLFCLGYGC